MFTAVICFLTLYISVWVTKLNLKKKKTRMSYIPRLTSKHCIRQFAIDPSPKSNSTPFLFFPPTLFVVLLSLDETRCQAGAGHANQLEKRCRWYICVFLGNGSTPFSGTRNCQTQIAYLNMCVCVMLCLYIRPIKPIKLCARFPLT